MFLLAAAALRGSYDPSRRLYEHAQTTAAARLKRPVVHLVFRQSVDLVERLAAHHTVQTNTNAMASGEGRRPPRAWFLPSGRADQ